MYSGGRTREQFHIPELDMTGMMLGDENYSNVKVLIIPENMSQFSEEQLKAMQDVKREIAAKKAATLQTVGAEVKKAEETNLATTTTPEKKLFSKWVYVGLVFSVAVFAYSYYDYKKKAAKK